MFQEHFRAAQVRHDTKYNRLPIATLALCGCGLSMQDQAINLLRTEVGKNIQNPILLCCVSPPRKQSMQNLGSF